MEFLENAILKAKDIFDVAAKKTGEVVAIEKQRFDMSSLRSKREKDYARLGKLYFEKIKTSDDVSEKEKAIVEQIKEKTMEINRLNAEIASAKNKSVCPECGANISDNSVFCNVCGAKISN